MRRRRVRLWICDRALRRDCQTEKQGIVIYPGKVTSVDTFRIGSIGDIDSSDIQRLLGAVRESVYWPQAIQR